MRFSHLICDRGSIASRLRNCHGTLPGENNAFFLNFSYVLSRACLGKPIVLCKNGQKEAFSAPAWACLCRCKSRTQYGWACQLAGPTLDSAQTNNGVVVFECFSCVCPEPVLAKWSHFILDYAKSTKADFYTSGFSILSAITAYVREKHTTPFEPFIYKNDLFTKAGSGQT